MLQEAANIKNTVVFDFPGHLLFTFNVFWGCLDTSIFGKSSSSANNTWSRLPSHYFSVFYDCDSGCGLVNLTMFLSALPGFRLFIQSKVQGKRNKIVTWVILEHSWFLIFGIIMKDFWKSSFFLHITFEELFISVYVVLKLDTAQYF